MFKIPEPKPVKMLFSRVPIGSIFFLQITAKNHYEYLCSRGNHPTSLYGFPLLEFLVEKQLGDLEVPHSDFIDDSMPLSSFVSYNDIKKYGFDYCVKHKKYTTIDSKYIYAVKKLRNIKTLKGLKELLEGKL